ncbi:hypothetical protein BGW80DRAFT_615285 [Lactifluus volemus]|nr:hypothetical protein BGW80DRAFT_615285 [Lactifluus volemus]
MARCQYCIISPDARRGHGRASDVVCSTTNVDECRPPYNKSRPNPWVDQPLDIMKISMKPASRTNRQTSTQLAPSDRTLASFFNSSRVRSRVFHFIHSFSFAIYVGLLISSLLSGPKTALSQSLPLSSMLPRSTSRRGWNLEKREKVTTATIIEYASKCEAKKKQEKEREDVKGVEERMNDSGRDVKNEREEQISKCLRNMATISRGKRKSRPDKGPSIGLEKTVR